MDIAIKKGQVYRCENCNAEVFKAPRDIKMGEVFGPGVVQGLQGHKTGDELRCKECGEFIGAVLMPGSWSY